jgi:hypothetical protein
MDDMLSRKIMYFIGLHHVKDLTNCYIALATWHTQLFPFFTSLFIMGNTARAKTACQMLISLVHAYSPSGTCISMGYQQHGLTKSICKARRCSIPDCCRNQYPGTVPELQSLLLRMFPKQNQSQRVLSYFLSSEHGSFCWVHLLRIRQDKEGWKW